MREFASAEFLNLFQTTVVLDSIATSHTQVKQRFKHENADSVMQSVGTSISGAHLTTSLPRGLSTMTYSVVARLVLQAVLQEKLGRDRQTARETETQRGRETERKKEREGEKERERERARKKGDLPFAHNPSERKREETEKERQIQRERRDREGDRETGDGDGMGMGTAHPPCPGAAQQNRQTEGGREGRKTIHFCENSARRSHSTSLRESVLTNDRKRALSQRFLVLRNHIDINLGAFVQQWACNLPREPNTP